jgi:hypothetical protein
MIRVTTLVLAIASMRSMSGTLSAPRAAVIAVSVARTQERSSPKPAPPEKDARTPAQRKINSQILYEIYRRRGEAEKKGVPPGPTDVRIDKKDRALVDLRANVTTALEKKLRDAGSRIISTSREHRSILAWIPILKIERIAADSSVLAVEPAAEASTRQ